jgi:hypothetical protein
MNYVVRELMDDAKSIGKRLDFSINKDYVTLYHGTSKKAGDEIKKSGFFQDGFFFSSVGKSEYGDTVYWYAKNRAKQKNETGNGMVLTMKVDVNSFHINTGTAEIESDGDLYLWQDGIWRNRKEKSRTELQLEFKNGLEISEDLQINKKFAWLLINTIHNWYFNIKIDESELLNKIKELVNDIKEKYDTKRKLYNFAKNYVGMPGEEIEKNLDILSNLDNIDVFIKQPISEKFITKFSIFEQIKTTKELPKNGEFIIFKNKYNNIICFTKVIKSAELINTDYIYIFTVNLFKYDAKDNKMGYDAKDNKMGYDAKDNVYYDNAFEFDLLFRTYDGDNAIEKYNMLNNAKKYNII